METCLSSHSYQGWYPDLAVPVALDLDSVLEPFERTVVRPTVVINNLEPQSFQNIVVNTSIADTSSQHVVF